jgi:catechol 2,3-dioxygenase-like lactoylglutathione lyase family enzyme
VSGAPVATLRRPRHVIAVPDLARSADWYRDVLGFEVHDVGDPGWRWFQRDACVILAGECPDALAPADTGDHAYFAYIEVDGIDALHAELAARGIDTIKPLCDEPWGMREFGVRTVDGHRMMFGEAIG